MPVMHMHQVAGKTAVSAVDAEGGIVSAWIGDMFAEHFKKVIATGDGWGPNDVYKVETKCSTWPMGWEKEYTATYFETREELDAHVANYQDWALSEDNRVQIRIYEWDLGPNLISELSFG